MDALKYAFLFLSINSLYSGINARNIDLKMFTNVFEELITGPCKAVTFVEDWPCFWMCGNETSIRSRCRDAVQKIKLNTSSYKDMTFCYRHVGDCITLNPKLACAKSYHIKDDQIIVPIIVCLSFAFTAVTMITFLMRRDKIKKDMKEITIFNNLCWIIVSICWIIQFFSRARTEIYSMDDSAIQQHQFELERYICGTSFVFLYYFSMAGVVWFVILTYSWYSFSERGTEKDLIRKIKYFHICAWSLPLFITLTMAITQAQGICFRVSNMNMGIILADMAHLLGGFFLTLSIFNTVKERPNRKDVESRQNFCHKMLLRGFIAVCLVVLCSIAFFCQAYDFNNEEEWNNSSQDYVHCLSKSSNQSSWSDAESSNPECVLKSKPNIFVFVIHMLSFMLFGTMVSLLLWNKSLFNVFLYYFCSSCAKCCDGLKSNFSPPPPRPPPTPPTKKRSPKTSNVVTFDVILFSYGTPATLFLSDVNDCSFSCHV